jgi:hypothetical protein
MVSHAVIITLLHGLSDVHIYVQSCDQSAAIKPWANPMKDEFIFNLGKEV